MLTALPLFAACTETQIADLNEIADLARIGPDEDLFQAGDQLGELNILIAGFVSETYPHRDGHAFTDVIAPVRPIGFAPALLGTISPTGARTITSARLVVLAGPELRALIKVQPDLALPFLDHALTSMREQTLELCQMKLRSSVQRLAEFLLGLVEDPQLSPARFVLPYEKRFLAARIGCSQENLSRAFAALRRLGVETQRGIVVIGDIAGLRAYAGLEVASAKIRFQAKMQVDDITVDTDQPAPS